MAKQVISDVHTFLNARMNTDDADIALKENEYRMIKNSLATAPGYVGKLKKMKGFKNVLSLALNSDFSLPSGTFTVIGSCEDIKNSAIVYFLCDTSANKNHGIFRMFTANNKVEWILNSQPFLNFQQNYPVSCFVLEDLLYFTDGYEGTPFVDYNPPRKINMVKACGMTNVYTNTKTYYTGMVVGYQVYDPATAGTFWHSYRYIYSHPSSGNIPTSPFWEVANISTYGIFNSGTIERIKIPPIQQPAIQYINDNTINYNNLRGYLFQFRYRYVYDDNENSVWSCDSDLGLPQYDDLPGGYIGGVFISIGGMLENLQNTNNAIEVTLNTGATNVKQIDLAVRVGNTGIWKQVESFYKYDANGNMLISSNIPHVYIFRNDYDGDPLDQADTERLQDFVPQISKLNILAENNRLFDANYIQDFDNVNLDVDISVITTLDYTQANGNAQINPIEVYPDPDLYDPFPPYQHSSTLWMSFPSTIPLNSIVQIVLYRYFFVSGKRPYYGDKTGAQPFTIIEVMLPGDSVHSMLQRIVTQINQQVASQFENMAYFTYHGGVNTIVLEYGSLASQDIPGYSYDMYFLNYVQAYVLVNTTKLHTYGSGATHLFAVQYYDYALRSLGVFTNGKCKAFIESNDQRYGGIPGSMEYYLPTNTLEFSLNSQPPMGACYWRLMYGGSTVQWRLQFGIQSQYIFNDGMYTYVPINYAIQTTVNSIKNFNIESYEWEKGDRLRIIATSEDFGYFQPVIDYEIVNQELIWVNSGTEAVITTADYFYQKDNAATPLWVYDANGNKVPELTYNTIVIPYVASPLLGKVNDSFLVIVEVYKPRRDINIDDNALYNEMPFLYPVINPNTINRAHGGDQNQHVANGIITSPAIVKPNFGDCYVKARISEGGSYFVEAMEFSDYYDSSCYGIGRPGVIIQNPVRNKYISKILYSGRFILDTSINELSKVFSSNSLILPDQDGAIAYLTQIGYILKVLQQKKPTSIQLNRVAFTQTTIETAIVGASQNVMSIPIPHDSDYGTTHMTGVVVHEKKIWFPDLYAGLILMDSDNGIHPISMEYKVHNFVSSHFASFLNDGIQNISIYSAYDELYGLVYFSFVDSVNPSLNFTIAFKEGTEQTSGFLAFDFVPDFYGSTKDTVTSWKNGLWVHNSNAVPLMNFYGTQYYPVISFVVNKATGITQDFKAMTLNATEEWFAPNAGDLTIDANGTYREKQTKIPKGKFRKKEGKFYTDIPRNMLTHSNTPTTGDMLNGDVMRGEVLEVNLTNDSVEDSEMTAITVNSNYSTGT